MVLRVALNVFLFDHLKSIFWFLDLKDQKGIADKHSGALYKCIFKKKKINCIFIDKCSNIYFEVCLTLRPLSLRSHSQQWFCPPPRDEWVRQEARLLPLMNAAAASDDEASVWSQNCLMARSRGVCWGRTENRLWALCPSLSVTCWQSLESCPLRPFRLRWKTDEVAAQMFSHSTNRPNQVDSLHQQ